MNFSEDPLDVEEGQVPISVKKEECLQRIKELQQQEQDQLKKQAALSRFACTIM